MRRRGRFASPLVRLAPLLFACVLLSPPAWAQEALQPAPPRIALALSGGGARGIAHIGALRALEEAGLPIEAIAATSMGAVIGGIYASGRDAKGLEDLVRSLDWAALFSGRTDRRLIPLARRADRYGPLVGVSLDFKGVRLPGGLLAEHRVNRFLIASLSPAGYAAGGDFDRLAIPFRAVATDLASGEPVVLAEGDLALAVRASLSIPLVFPPVEWQGRRLVDGLVADNLPCDVARTFGAAVTVSVDVSSPPLEPSEYESALGVATRVNDLLLERRNRDFRREADVTIRPDLGTHSMADYSDLDPLIRKAYEATKASIPAIREKLAAAGIADIAPRKPAARGPRLEGARIAGVVVRGNQRVSERLLRRAFNIPQGPAYVMERGLRAFDKLEATGLVERSWLEFEPDGDGVRIVLRVKEAPPNRVEVGGGYSEWEKARGHVRLRNQDTLGFGEQLELLLAASDAHMLGQLSLQGDRLILSGLGYRATAYAWSDEPRFFDAGGALVNRASFERDGVELALRTSLTRSGLLEAGLRLGRVKTHQRAGTDLLEADDAVRTLFGTLALDTLDSLDWPERGQRLALCAEWSPERMASAHESWRAEIMGRLGRKLGPRGVLQLDGLLGVSGRDLPVYDWHRVGGSVLVPGYHHEELRGPQTFGGAVSVRYRLLRELRVLVRAGAGNVFARRGEIGLEGIRWGLGAGAYHPSPIGPVSIEIGFRDDGNALVSLSVGWN